MLCRLAKSAVAHKVDNTRPGHCLRALIRCRHTRLLRAVLGQRNTIQLNALFNGKVQVRRECLIKRIRLERDILKRAWTISLGRFVTNDIGVRDTRLPVLQNDVGFLKRQTCLGHEGRTIDKAARLQLLRRL